MNVITRKELSNEDLDIFWEGKPHPSDHLCPKCRKPARQGLYYWADRRTGEPADDKRLYPGLLCDEHGPLDMQGNPLKPPDQID